MEQKNIFLLAFIGIVFLVASCILTWNWLDRREFENAYSSTNQAYEQVLLATAKASPDSLQKMQDYVTAWDKFTAKYWKVPPKRFVTEQTWWPALNRITDLIDTSSILIKQGKISDANKELLKVHSAWQQVFEKQQASMIGYYLVEFNAELSSTVTETRSEQYGLLPQRCERLRTIWDEVIDAPVTVAAQRMQDFDTQVLKESDNIDEFCAAVSSQNNTRLRELASALQEGFGIIYTKYG